ncbi:3687_t:CDS:2, partial [Dentiscutata erythropus]
FLVSNIELGDNTRIELKDLPIKDQICKKQEKLRKKNKEKERKANELETENKFLYKQNKKSKKNFKIELKILKEHEKEESEAGI